MSVDIQTLVVGSGVVGLAIARNLSAAGQEVVIAEKEKLFGSETSARNSEVIHAGIYYPKNSLKAKLCVAGKALLYQYCQSRTIKHKRCEKLIVAADAKQDATLLDIQQRGLNNGVTDLKLLKSHEVQQLEPQLSATSALLSPSTGIIDSHGLMLSFLGDAENNGAMIAYNTKVNRIEAHHSGLGFAVTLQDTQDHTINEIHCANLINCAGHDAPRLANQLSKSTIKASYTKGNYFKLVGPAPVSRLIYPVPEVGGLGVHITLDLLGQVRFGPDVEVVERMDYTVDINRAEKFYAAIRTYWPELKDDSLIADYAGLRPKVSIDNKLADDFIIQNGAEFSQPGLINLLGIESPGLTSCLAIADHVEQLLKKT